MAKATDTEELQEAAREGAKEGAKLAREKAQNKELSLKERAATKAAKAARRVADEALSGPNLTQIAIGGVSGVVGGAVGYKVNQLIRVKTAEWGWVNEEGERSIGSVLLADVAPPVLGLLLTVGGAFLKNGALSAAIMGFGMGMAGGSVTSTAFGPD